MLLLILAATAAVATAQPRYIALPADQIAFVDLRGLHVRTPRHIRVPRHVRVPRQNLEPPPLPQLPQGLYQNDYLPYQPALSKYQVQEDGGQEPIQTYQAVPIPIQRYAPIPIGVAPQPQPPPQQAAAAAQPEPEDAASAASDTRPPDFGEYVDFGAHTGDNGAFGWYADYPINAYEHRR